MARRGNLRMEAYHWLRQRVVSAEFAPGSALTERQVAEELGISTVPVREALLLLAGHHLVQSHNGTGYSIASIEVPDADSRLRLQVQLEAEAAAEAARARRIDTREHLEMILASVGPKANHTWDDPACNSHFDFHVHVAAHAGHPALAKALQDNMLETERTRRHLLRLGADVGHDVALHAGLIEAIERGPAPARRAARDHALAHRDQLLAALAAHLQRLAS